MLSEKLTQLGLPNDISYYANGINLAHLVNRLLYNNNNQLFISKLANKDQHRKGQQIVNISIVLKQIKTDNNIQIPPQITALTAFDIIQKQQKLIVLLSWLLNSTHQYQSAFDNLYFASNLGDHPSPHYSDSLDQEKVVKKGSFKILKPKTDFQLEQQLNQFDIQKSSSKPQHTHKQTQQKENNQENQSNNYILHPSERKTIPKLHQKPPLYRHNKENTNHTSHYHLEPTSSPKPFREDSTHHSSAKQQQLIKQILSLDQQIKKEGTKSERSINKESRVKEGINKENNQKNIFKLDIADVANEDRKKIVQWLIGINLLNSLAINYYHNLHQICKDGVIFPQIINYQIGRGHQLCYFKSPKRIPQLNSNYQKVFNYLAEIPHFHNQLLYLYDYFIPQAHEKSFWSLLKSIYLSFSKPRKQSVIKQKPKLCNNDNSDIYQTIKYGSSSSCSKPPKQPSKTRSEHKIEIVEEIPYTQNIKAKLIQNQQPNESINRGYKQIYERKSSRKYDTPKKSISGINSSMSRSRILSMGSIRKSEKKVEMPTLTMQMEEKAIEFLKRNQCNSFFQKENKELFDDPVRNGVLINEIIIKYLKTTINYHLKVKNIENCRDNYQNAINSIKKYTNVHPGYEAYKQQIIKGDLTLFYGLIYIINTCLPNLVQTDPTIKNAYIPHPIKVEINLNKEQDKEVVILWVRQLQQYSEDISQMKIRDIKKLIESITKQNMLYQLLEVLTQKRNQLSPNFAHPKNQVEQQSNLKKILTVMVQKKWISSQFIMKASKIVKGDIINLSQLLTSIINLTNNILPNSKDHRVTFAKYLRPHQMIKNAQRLDTTMANQSQHKNPIDQISNIQETDSNIKIKQRTQQLHSSNILEVKWMRKLGFTGNLNLNDGVLLCKLITRLTMKTIEGVNFNPQSRAQCLTNIRKAIKVIGKHLKWQQNDIIDADIRTNLQIYAYLKQRYKHAYALKFVNDK